MLFIINTLSRRLIDSFNSLFHFVLFRMAGIICKTFGVCSHMQLRHYNYILIYFLRLSLLPNLVSLHAQRSRSQTLFSLVKLTISILFPLHNRRKQLNEPIKIRSRFMWLGSGEGKCARARAQVTVGRGKVERILPTSPKEN